MNWLRHALDFDSPIVLARRQWCVCGCNRSSDLLFIEVIVHNEGTERFRWVSWSCCLGHSRAHTRNQKRTLSRFLVAAVAAEEVDHTLVVARSGKLHRRLLVVRQGVDVGAVRDEELHDSKAVVVGGVVQRYGRPSERRARLSAPTSIG